MHFSFSKRYIAPVLFGLFITTNSAEGAVPTGFYSACENKGGKALLEALNATVGPHTIVGYGDLWQLYTKTDVRPNGSIWDMYSTKEWVAVKEQCGNYSLVGDCYNREHSMPKSWFNDQLPMYSDAFHLYPTDGKVNSQRSNFPYGECANGVTLPSKGDIKALGRLGKSTFPGYTETVFEPADEYKGDFARSYFYMAAAYNDQIASWSSDMLAGNSYPAFTDWTVNLLLKWHSQDPVSQKEIDRNEAVYAAQQNRNPFIDHPEMVDYIWGEKKNELWSMAVASKPAILQPVDGTTMTLGHGAAGMSRTWTLTVLGRSLTENVAVSINGEGWTVTPSTLSADAVNHIDGTTVKVTYNCATEGEKTARLTFSSSGVSSSVSLKANVLNGFPQCEPTDISDQSFVAHWVNIGHADATGYYTLFVKDASGEDIDTYPRSVKATDESAIVDELEPKTTYTVYLTTGDGIKSNVRTVTTADPVPSVRILYDGELTLTAEPGIPGEPAELFLDIDNINTDLIFEVDSPFELSSDRTNWTRRLLVDSREDRVYIRLNSETNGNFKTSIRVNAGDYYNDDAEVIGIVALVTDFNETFENPNGVNGTYAKSPFVFEGVAAKWILSGTGAFKVASEAHDGLCYIRFDKSGERTAELAEDRTFGIGTVTLWAAAWSAKDGATAFALDYSTDSGQTWETAGTASLEAPAGSTKDYKEFRFVVNKTGNVRIRVRQTEGQRMCLDDVAMTDWRAGVEGVFADELGTGWDARSVDGHLVIDLEKNADVSVYSVSGITILNENLSAGSTTLSVEPGLYIVAVGQSTRRVLVK